MLLISRVQSFAPIACISTGTPATRTDTTLGLENKGERDNDDTNPGRNPNRQQRQMVLEELSRLGADKIAQLNVAERTARALLAEAVEDRIFELTEQLEALLGMSSIATTTTVDVADIQAERREQAVQLAQQTKVLKQQYEELVSGEPSSLLGALKDLTRLNKTDYDKES